MKIFNIPLHIQILLALALGAVFGSIFNIDQHKLKINYKNIKGNQAEIFIERWDSLSILYHNKTGEIIKSLKFDADDQLQIINYFKKSDKNEKKYSVIKVYKVVNVIDISNVTGIAKIGTIATKIKFLGTIFIRLLSFLAIPLVIATLILGAASLGDIKKIGRIGGKTLALYISTTMLAIIIGLVTANLIQPGEKISQQTSNRLMGAYQEDSPIEAVENLNVDIIDFLVDIVPKNPIKAMAEGNMLQIVFFAVIFGITLTFIEKKKFDAVSQFFDGVAETMVSMVGMIMKFAPFGVFALISSTVAEFGFSIISTLIWYILAVLIGLTIHTVIVYSLIVKYLGKMSLSKFFKGIRNAQVIGFSTSSSAATLPVTLDCAENNLGIPKHIASFVLPLGATINMDGTALYQGVAAVFIAQVFGFDLNISQQLTIVFTATLASIGTAPVPGVGIIMLIMILQSVNLPPEGIALIIGVDRFLDMCRTITNISGDLAVATAIKAGEEKHRTL